MTGHDNECQCQQCELFRSIRMEFYRQNAIQALASIPHKVARTLDAIHTAAYEWREKARK